MIGAVPIASAEADRADEETVERMRKSLEQLSDEQLADPVLVRRCYLALRAPPADIMRFGDAAATVERIRRAVMRALAPTAPGMGGAA